MFRGSRTKAITALFCVATTSKVGANYIDVSYKANKYQLATLHNAKNGVHVYSKFAYNTRPFFGLGYGVKGNGFTFIAGVRTDGSDITDHFTYLSYKPKTIKIGYDVEHTSEYVRFSFTYDLAESWGVNLSLNSNNQIGLGFRKWTE